MEILKPKLHLSAFALILVFFTSFGALGENKIDKKTKDKPASGALASKTTLKVGLVLPLSGSLEASGKDFYRGVEHALAELKNKVGPKVILKVKDNQSDPLLSAQLTKELILKDRVSVILGPIQEANLLAAAAIAEEFRTPMLSPSLVDLSQQNLGEYVFVVSASQKRMIDSLVHYAVTQLKRPSFGLLVDQSSQQSIMQAKYFKEAATKLGAKVLLEQQFVTGLADFSPVVQNFVTHKVNTVFVPGAAADVSKLTKFAYDVGQRWVFLGSDQWEDKKLFVENGKAIVGHYFPLPYHHGVAVVGNQDFVKVFTEAHKSLPGVYAAAGFDLFNVLIEGDNHSKLKGAAIALKESIETLKAFPALLAPLDMDPLRRRQRPVVIMETQAVRATVKAIRD
ncbi:ABC transporter substrate-binding protein [bacterium]|nr:ABC transporter substrate-binding protein [bacterium]